MSDFNYEEAIHARLRGGIISFSVVGIATFIYIIIDGVKDAKDFKKKSLEREIKQEVLNIVDKDSNGLSFSEDYKIKELMGIQDSSKTYIPTTKDWERAYNKLNK